MKFDAGKLGNDYSVTVRDDRRGDTYRLTATERTSLLDCIDQALTGSDNEYICKDGGRFKLTFQISDRHSCNYYVHKSELVALKIQLMGV